MSIKKPGGEQCHIFCVCSFNKSILASNQNQLIFPPTNFVELLDFLPSIWSITYFLPHII